MPKTKRPVTINVVEENLTPTIIHPPVVRPLRDQPSYEAATVRPVIIMNPATLRTTTSRTPPVSSTLSPETLMMNEMRNYIVDHMPVTIKPAIQKPRTMKTTTKRPKTQKPRTQKPRPAIIMNPATLRTTTRRTPPVSSTLSPETIMMNQMRGIISHQGRDSMIFLSFSHYHHQILTEGG